jgi:AraC-like DNA-binding protein
MWTNDLWVVGMTGAVLGGALGWPLLRRPNDTAGTRIPIRLLGAMLLMGAAAVGLIAADHGDLLSPAAALVTGHVVYAGDLVFWALFVIWVRRAIGAGTVTPAWVVLLSAPLVAYAAYAAQGHGPPPFVWLLPVGTASIAYAAASWFRAGKYRSTSFEDLLLTRIVAFAAALDTAQAVRTFWPHVGAVREIVPITMTAGFLSIAVFAMRELFAACRVPAQETTARYAKSALDEASGEQLLLDLERGMREEHWYRDPTLSLATLALKVGARPHAVSQALNQVDGRSLNEYLTVWRVADARRLLADPESDRFTIDALAESAGFASRSAFYKSFKALEGLTPTAFRMRAREELRRFATSMNGGTG